MPFWTSYLLRVMAWKLMLGTNGRDQLAARRSGLIDEPLDALLYNRGASIVTLIYVWIPFATLPILAALGASTSGSTKPRPTCTRRRWQQFRA